MSPSPASMSAAVQHLANQQHRCVSLRQLAELGVPSSTIASRTRPTRGQWTRMLPGIVLVHRGTPTPDELASAALLYGGDGSVLSGAESLRRQGLNRLAGTREIHLLIPDGRRRRSVDFVVCERTRRMPVPRPVAGFPCSPVPRALVDACRQLHHLEPVRAAAAEAVQRRMCSQEELLTEVAAAQRRRTARIRLVSAEVVGGIRSAIEGDARRLLRQEGLPDALWNHDIVTSLGEWVGCPDAWFDREAIALEIDSREWHLDPRSWERTQLKRARFARFGITTIPVTPRRLYRERSELVTDIRGALERGRQVPRPDVRAVMRSQAA